MYKITNENLFADSITAIDEDEEDNEIEVKVLLDAEEDEIKERFNDYIPLASLCVYVTLNKYTKVINCIQFILENEQGQSKRVDTSLTFEEQECIRKVAATEIKRNYIQNH